MAEKRLGANFTIDTSSLKAGLQQANRLIRESEAQFRAAAAGIDDWSHSEEGLTKRQKALTEQIGIQRQKISALVSEKQRIIEKLKAEGASDDDVAKATDSLNKQIAKESKQLDSLDRDLSQTNKSLKDLKSGNDAAEASAKKAGDGFTVLKGTLANLAASGFRAALSGAKKLASELVNLGEKADELNTISKQSGFSTEELQKFEYAAEMIDVETNTIIGAARKMAKNLTSTSEQTIGAFNRLGVQIRDGNGELRDRNTVFYEVVAALGAVTNETERDTLAMQIFGKSADELAGLIDDGGEALKQYGEEAEKLGIIMSEDTVDSANEFNDAVDRIKNTAKGAFAKIGGEIAKELAPEVDNLRDGLQKLVKGIDWKSVVQKGVELIKNVIKIGTQLGKTVLPLVYTSVKFLADNFKTLGPAIMIAVGAIKAATIAQAALNGVMLANPIGAVVSAVALLVGGLALLISSTNEAAGSVDLLTASQRETFETAQEVAAAFDEQKKAADRVAEQELYQIDRTKDLYKELQTLVDENGKVVSGYETRADFIVGELNEALGTELKLNGDVVDGYRELSGSIDELIEKKKAKILFDAYEETYTEALKNKTTVERGAAAAALELAEAENHRTDVVFALADAQEKLENATNPVDIWNYGSAVHELEQELSATDSKIKELTEKYNEADKALQANRTAIEQYDAATKEFTSGTVEGVENATKILSGYGQAVEDAAAGVKNADEEHMKRLSDRVIFDEFTYQKLLLDYQNLCDQYVAEGKSMSEEEQSIWDERIKTALEQANNSKQEFFAIGGNIIKSVASGAESESWVLSDTMSQMVKIMLRAAKDAAGIASPSKVFKQVIGKNIGLGIIGGISESTAGAVKAASEQISALRKVYEQDANFEAEVSAKKADKTFGSGGVRGGIVVNQTNVYSQAHTRYELYESKQATIAAVRLAQEAGA